MLGMVTPRTLLILGAKVKGQGHWGQLHLIITNELNISPQRRGLVQCLCLFVIQWSLKGSTGPTQSYGSLDLFGSSGSLGTFRYSGTFGAFGSLRTFWSSGILGTFGSSGTFGS